MKHAIRNAEPDAQRFLSSAKLKASEVDRSLSFAADERLEAFLSQVEGLKSVDELTAIQEQLKLRTYAASLVRQSSDSRFWGFAFLSPTEVQKSLRNSRRPWRS